MQRIKYIIGFMVITAATWYSSIYSFSVISIEGTNKPLAAYQGKKMLFIILPSVQNGATDSLLQSIDSLRTANGSSLVVIGVPSFQEEYTVAQKEQLKEWYRTRLDTTILITEGMHTHKFSGSQQHPLFSWLTNSSENGHFNEDVYGVGHKFLVRANGELFGVLGPRTKLSSNALRRMLESQ